MGIKILRLRHRFPPEVNGCRWCGVSAQGHGLFWTPAARWHAHVQPTDAQRLARLRARRNPGPRVMIPWKETANRERTRL